MENTQLLIVRHRKKFIAAFLMVFFLMAFGCSFYGGIKGAVLDNTTGKPIEGAVVVAQWTKERGIPGMQYHNLHKITETLTDNNGKFSLSGTFGILLEPPQMIIYKEGYIPWRNDMVYPGGMPGYEKSNEWKSRQTYRLDAFTGTGKAIIELSTFTSYGFMVEGFGNTPLFNKHVSLLEDAELREMKRIQKKQN